jgi:hypothetical protein
MLKFISSNRSDRIDHTVAYTRILKANTAKPHKQPLPGNGYETRNNGVTAGSGVFSDSNIPTGSNIWSQVPQGCSIPRHTD